MYRATTRSIQVTVEPTFMDDESSPSDNRYFWAYAVEITNHGEEVVQLRSRHWQRPHRRGPRRRRRRQTAGAQTR
jgi:ApaG protein